MVGGLRAVRVLAVGLGPALALAGLVTLMGCGPVVDQGVSIVTDARALRARPSIPPGVAVGCMAAVASGTLAAGLDDPALVWLDADGERLDLTWPYGFRVRFVPDAEVLAPGGEVVAREGQAISFGGGWVAGTFEICAIDGVNF